MRLRSITIENFRDVRRGGIDLAPATVLIGENDCGKSRILEALCLALDNGAVGCKFSPDHFRPDSSGSPIRIVVTFSERIAGEWMTDVYRPIHCLLAPRIDGPQQLKLEIVAGTPRAQAHWCISGPSGMCTEEDHPELLTWLREHNPIVRLPQGLMANDQDRPRIRNKEVKACAELVERHYAALVGGTTANAAFDLEAGYNAAQNLIAISSQHLEPAAHRSTWLLQEISQRPSNRSSGQPQAPPSTTIAYKIGLLLFVGGLLRANPKTFKAEAEPIVILEDPESHLHPMTLACVWSLIERMRWQTIVSTHSGVLLSEAPLQAIRRLTRINDTVRVFQVREHGLSRGDVRKLRYHVRSRRGAAMFARCWLLVEGETEFWLIPELARLLGYNLDAEGIACVEFAQCGLPPLIKAARELGIEWHLLTDGDHAGEVYSATAERLCPPNLRPLRITRLREPDVEHCFWRHGYACTIQQVARTHAGMTANPKRVIRAAIEKASKPYLALQLLEGVAANGSAGVPYPLRNVIETCVRLSRTGTDSLQGTSLPPRNILEMEARKQPRS